MFKLVSHFLLKCKLNKYENFKVILAKVDKHNFYKVNQNTL